MNRSIIFFDIDQTLWDSTNIIPDSAKEAIEKLKANGHKVFINSGRTRSFINAPQLINLGFDGYVSGCGTMIEAGEKILFCHEIDRELAEYTMDVLRSENVHVILEGRKDLYMDYDFFSPTEYGKRLEKGMPAGHLHDVEETRGNWQISKMSILLDNSDVNVLHEKLDEHYTFMKHRSDIYELVPKGYDKGTGAVKACELMNIDLKDSYAFGDSSNDLEMMQAVAHPIAMGNGQDHIKKICEFVTTGLYDDGIYNGCLHYGLI